MKLKRRRTSHLNQNQISQPNQEPEPKEDNKQPSSPKKSEPKENKPDNKQPSSPKKTKKIIKPKSKLVQLDSNVDPSLNGLVEIKL